MNLLDRQYSVFYVFGTILFALLVALGGTVLAQELKDPEEVMLPVVLAPSTMEGEIGFSSPRFEGVTTFVPELILDFSDLKLDPEPAEMKIWHENEDPTTVDWIPYEPTYEKEFAPEGNGIQQINVAMRASSGYQHTLAVVFFYIPSGDFAVDDKMVLEGEGWQLLEDDLPLSIESQTLRLGGSNFVCDKMPYPAFASAAIDLVLPEEGNYYLRLEGTITTYDQLPDPGQDKYDAFEVLLGGELLGRHGNPEEPLNCDTERQVPLNETYDLRLYEGEMILSLENHSRFDEFYNTYTDIYQIWVDLEDSQRSVPKDPDHNDILADPQAMNVVREDFVKE